MIRNVAVIGAGTMGHGIAHTFSRHGYKVNLYDAFEPMLETVVDSMREELAFMAEEDYISREDVETALGNIKICRDLKEAVEAVDIVVEAVTEKLGIKKTLFGELDKYCRPDTVFASNTSSLKLSEMIEDLPEERKKYCMVTHW